VLLLLNKLRAGKHKDCEQLFQKVKVEEQIKVNNGQKKYGFLNSCEHKI